MWSPFLPVPGTSVMNMAKWAQSVRKSRQPGGPVFEKYDFGNVCVSPSGLPRTCNLR